MRYSICKISDFGLFWSGGIPTMHTHAKILMVNSYIIMYEK